MSIAPRRTRLAAATLLAWACLHAQARAMDLPTDLPPDSPALASAERQALIEWQRDPIANGEALLRINPGSARRLPLVTVLAAADVHLRAGRLRAATRFFREAARRDAAPPWGTFAALGLGWTALARHDFGAAAKYYRSVDPAGPFGAMARVMLAWVTAFRGRYAEAVPLFDRAASAADVAPNVRQVAMLGAAYARYWLGTFDDAAAAFDRLVSPPSLLSDDARYGAAWSRVRAGELDVALPALVALAADTEDDPHAAPVPDAAVRLTPTTVARTGRDGTRISGFAGPDARMVAMFDGDGAALARAALRLLGRREASGADAPLAPGVPVLAERDAAPPVPGTSEPAARRDGAPVSGTAVPAPTHDPAPRAWWLVAAVAALVVVALGRRRSAARS